jgi:hypothetical protein
MLSIEKCNEILNKKEKTYTKEEVKAIREVLYQFAKIIYEGKKEIDEKS